ncbi:hypothetical protein BH18THE2_BH18THE2_42680 [soil metagenome]
MLHIILSTSTTRFSVTTSYESLAELTMTLTKARTNSEIVVV